MDLERTKFSHLDRSTISMTSQDTELVNTNGNVNYEANLSPECAFKSPSN